MIPSYTINCGTENAARLTIGSLAGIAAFLLGLLSTSPTGKKMGILAGQMQVAGGPPKPEQVAQMERLQAELAVIEGVGHGIHEERPAEYVQALEQFMAAAGVG